MSFPYNQDQLLWLEDLETTNAEQGQGALHENDKFCCLGRGCLVLGIPGKLIPNPFGMRTVEYQGSSTIAPDSLIKRLRLRDCYGSVREDILGNSSLVYLNDSKVSFKEIAAIVRANPEGYFTNLEDRQ